MKKNVVKYISIVILVFAFNFINAQTNFGYINTDLVLSQMAETEEVGDRLQMLGESYDQEFKTIYEEYDAKKKKYESEASTISESINRVRAQELLSLEEGMQQFRQNASNDMSLKQREFMAPVIEKMNRAIEEVAKSKNIDFVFDTSQRNLAYSNEVYNLISAVKEKLGIK